VWLYTGCNQFKTAVFLFWNLATGNCSPVAISCSPVQLPVFFAVLDWTLKHYFLVSLILLTPWNIPSISPNWTSGGGIHNSIWIKEINQWKAAFTTPYGLYEPMVMFFGQCNSPPTFQAFMNHIFTDYLMEGWLIIYVHGQPHGALGWFGRTHLVCLVGSSTFAQAQAQRKVGEMYLLHTPGRIHILGWLLAKDRSRWTLSNLGPSMTGSPLAQSAQYTLLWASAISIASLFLTSPTLFNHSFLWQKRMRHGSGFWIMSPCSSSSKMPFFSTLSSITLILISLSSLWLTLCLLPLMLCWCKRMAIGISTPAPIILRLSLQPSEIMISTYDRKLLIVICALEEWCQYLTGIKYPVIIIVDDWNLMYFKSPQNLS